MMKKAISAIPSIPSIPSLCMAIPSIPLLLVVTTVLCFFIAIILVKRSSRSIVNPPGPRGLPIIGHLHLLGVLPHQSLYRLSKTYGPLFSLNLGAVPVLVASTPDMAKLILQTHIKVFSGRPQNLTIAKNIFGCPEMIYSCPDPYWKLMREICATEIFSNKRVEYFRPVRMQELGALMLSILDAAGTPLMLRDLMQRTNHNVISRITLSKSVSEVSTTSPNASSILSVISEVVDLIGVFNVGDFLPSLAWMDLQGYVKQSKDVARKASSAFQEVIDRRRKSHGSDDPPQDFLDLILLASFNPKYKEFQIEDINIRAFLIDMFLGGTYTIGFTTEWALAELLSDPRTLKTAQEEVDEVVGSSRLVEESDIRELPYLRAVVKETMRLHPLAPLLGPHVSLESCEIAELGYHIHKNTQVFVNVWAIGRDPTVWDNPLEFRPERFLDSNIEVLGQNFEILPFGSGRRICPASKMALLTVQILLAHLLHAFDWTTSFEKMDMQEERYGAIVRKLNPLVVLPRPRLAIPLYKGYK